MQALFFMDMRPDANGQDRLALFCRSCPPPKKSLPFFLDLVEGVSRYVDQIDAIIERFSSHWKIARMGGVDRNVIRVAVYELLCCSDIPPKVSINEAIDIGKKYGTEESGAFINGILDAIHLALTRQDPAVRLTAQEEPVAPSRDEPLPAPGPAPPAPVETVTRVQVRRGLVRRRNQAD